MTKNMARIMIVEDEPAISDLLAINLKLESAADGKG